MDLQTAIAIILTNPNETWKNLKREKYMVPKSCFQWVDHLFEQSCITASNKYNAKKLKKLKEDFEKKLNTDSNRNNNHQSKRNMEEPKKRKIHGTEIILPKQLLNLNPSGPTDYN